MSQYEIGLNLNHDKMPTDFLKPSSEVSSEVSYAIAEIYTQLYNLYAR